MCQITGKYMKGLLPYTINVGGKLMDLSEPQVMGILNITPDSFYSESRKNTKEEIAERVNAILAEGGSMIDVGAYSSRPGADDISEEEEMRRLRGALQILRRIAPGGTGKCRYVQGRCCPNVCRGIRRTDNK